MTVQELAQQILAIAQKALAHEHGVFIYVTDTCEARTGLESIVKLCVGVPPTQEAYKQYEKKKVSHAKTSEDTQAH